MAWRDDGLLCAPRAAPDLARAALAACPLPVRDVAAVPGWPAPPSDHVAGWYRRGPRHAPAPPGVREILQVDGPAFGAAGHETTGLCLEALDGLPDGPALDAGCGSGALALAWAALGKGAVEAVDLDPDAVRQTARAAELAGLAGVAVRRAPLDTVDAAGRVLLANLPPVGHAALARGLTGPPRAAVLCGMRAPDRDRVAEPYLALGMRVAGEARRGPWERLTLVAA